MRIKKNKTLAYLVGVALGDGNLSNPSGRAIRLRITCDLRYKRILSEVTSALARSFPKNKISFIYPTTPTKIYVNISLYSNGLYSIMPWRVGSGSKIAQQARVPDWIKANKAYSIACLRGLLQTDGSIYRDRGYLMVNFVNHIAPLADDVRNMLEALGFHPRMYTIREVGGNMKHTVRVARQTEALLKTLSLSKT